MKKTAAFFVFLAIGIVVCFFIIKQADWNSVKEGLANLEKWQWIAILILYCGVQMSGALRWKIILESKQAKIKYVDALSAYIASHAISFFAPPLALGGEAIKAYIIKDRYSLTFREVLATVILDKMLIAMLVVPSALAAFIYFFAKKHLFLWLGLIIFLAYIVHFLVKLMKWNIPAADGLEKAGKGALAAFVHDFKGAVAFLQTRKFFDEIIWLAVAEFGFALAETWVIVYSIFGEYKNIVEAFWVQSFGYLAHVFMVPGNIGSMEAMQLFIFKSIFGQPDLAVVYSIIARSAELILALAGIAFLMVFYLDKINDMLFGYDQS